jgi:hypothetical protein
MSVPQKALKKSSVRDSSNLTVRSLDVKVPCPSTNINAKRISITGIYFAFFGGEQK